MRNFASNGTSNDFLMKDLYEGSLVLTALFLPGSFARETFRILIHYLDFIQSMVVLMMSIHRIFV